MPYTDLKIYYFIVNIWNIRSVGRLRNVKFYGQTEELKQNQKGFLRPALEKGKEGRLEVVEDNKENDSQGEQNLNIHMV